jgi:agmatinase
MDPQRLARLRARYQGASGNDGTDPLLKAVGNLNFRDGDRRAWPFAGIPTFMGLPSVTSPLAPRALEGIDVVVVGVPMDLGVTNRAGARLGPRAVRSIERVGPMDHALRIAPALHLKAVDAGDVPFASRFDLEGCHTDIEQHFSALAAAGVRTLAVGGDHSISYPILRALGRGRPLGLVHIDAHCDTSGVYEGSKFHHGGPFRQAVLDGVLDPERTIQIGIRGGAEYLWEFSTESGMTVVHAEAVAEKGLAAVIAEARRVVEGGPVYISFDIDSVDPGFAPGTGTPEVGGLTPREVLAILRGLAGLEIAGADVVEVAPQYDATSNTAHIAAQVLFTELCLMAALRPSKA